MYQELWSDNNGGTGHQDLKKQTNNNNNNNNKAYKITSLEPFSATVMSH